MKKKYVMVAVVGTSFALCAAVVVVVGVLKVRNAADTREADLGRPACSHWCVYRCSRMLGAPVDMDEVLRLLPPRATGHSLREVRDALRQIGLEANGCQESYDAFLEGEFPCIVHLKDPDHFVFAMERTRGGIRAFDASGYRRRLEDEAVAKRWSGGLLRVKRMPTCLALPQFRDRAALDAPCLQFETLHVDKGDIPISAPVVSFVYPFVNCGRQPLIIKRVQTDCRCLEVKEPSDPIGPGGHGEIVLKYNALASRARGVFQHEAIVESNDPTYPILPLCASGNADARVTFAPAKIDLGDVVSGGSATGMCFVYYRGEDCDSFAIDACRCSLPGVHTDVINGAHYQASGATIPGVLLADSSSHVRVIRLTIATSVDVAPGTELSGTLDFQTNVEGVGSLSVPVRGRIVPRVSAAPNPMNFGELRDPAHGVRSAYVTLRSATGKNIRVLRAKCPRSGDSLSYSVEYRQGSAMVKVTCDEAVALRNHKSEVVFEVHIEGEEQPVSVPVKLYVWGG